MRIVRTALPAVLVVGLVAGSTGDDDPLAFRPRSGTSLSRTWTEGMTWTLEDMQMMLDGSPLEQELPEAGGTHRMALAFEDEVQAVGEARIEALRRTFAKIDAETSFHVDLGDGDDSEYGVRSTSELVDQDVVYTWDEDDAAYGVAFAEESGGDASLLEGLEEDMDLLAFLPPGEVEVGEEWEVGPAALRAILAPGGNLHSRPESWIEGSLFTVPTATIVASALATLPESAAGTIEGDVVGRYAGTEEVEGGTLAVIEFDVDVRIETDKTARFRAFCAKVMGDEGNDLLSLEDEVDLSGKGRIRWDPAAGRFRSLEFEGEVILTASMAWTDSLVIDDERAEFSGTFEISGTTSIAAESTAE